MMRTRLLWFGVGFSFTGAAISHLIWKDLMVDRFALSSDVKHKFDALESRIVNLEHSYQNPNPNPAAQVLFGVFFCLSDCISDIVEFLILFSLTIHAHWEFGEHFSDSLQNRSSNLGKPIFRTCNDHIEIHVFSILRVRSQLQHLKIVRIQVTLFRRACFLPGKSIVPRCKMLYQL